jgi:SEFIR domain.
MINIKYGGVFDDKCDLLILPCSSTGSVTRWVKSEIEKHGLPFPSYNIPFGSIAFLDTESRYRNAYYIGYASSVKAKDYSDLNAIKNILIRIIEYCSEKDVTLVNIPVLGTGAGSLKHNEVIDLYYSELDNSRIEFNVYIPNRDIASVFINNDNNESKDKLRNPRVFISYSWGNSEVQEWVKNLTVQLCDNGVNARLDMYHLKAGYDMPQWMTDEVIKADKVLLICDEYYAEKANLRKAGVGWETMIVQGDMLTQGLNNKYIAISYGDFDRSIPIYMKSKLAMSKEEIDLDIKNLLANIYELDNTPEVKEIPTWIKEKLI